MVVTWPQGTDPNVTSYWGQSSWDLTLQTKRPCSWEKISMAQIPQTNSSHPGWFSVCNCQILSKGDHTIPTIPLDSSKFGSLFTVPLLLEGLGAGTQKYFLFSGANPPSGCPLYLHINLPFSLCYKYPHQPPPTLGPSPGLFRMQRSVLTFVWPAHLESRPPHHKPSSQDWEWRLRVAPAHFPRSSQAEGRKISGFCILTQYVYDYCCFHLLKEFFELSPSLRLLHGSGSDVGRAYIYVGFGTLAPITVVSWQIGVGRGVTHRTAAWTGTTEEVTEPSKICVQGAAFQVWRLGSNRPNPALLNTPGQHGFPDADLQSRRGGPSLAWPGQPAPQRAWYWTNCFLPKRAKDSAKSAISIWEVRFSQNTTPLPLLLYFFQYLKGRGRQKTCSTRPLNRIKGFLYAVVPPSWP